ncbi:MAG TPA: L-fucose/L-arabinose isomerase family protein [Victivallales bacterium]|nr:L-fucose/L-arabinose isomerase family protein [Victivallales bacterium]
MSNEKMRVGFFSIGLDTYWDQFDGLKDNLLGYHQTVKNKISAFGTQVIDAGLVDTPEKAKTAGRQFLREDVEIIFLFITTYALSSTVLPVVQKAKVPVIILNLQPVEQLDYESFNNLGDRWKMTGVWLEHCQACSLPEIACVFNRAGISYYQVSGYLKDKEAWNEINEWVQAALVKKEMSDNRVGILGNYYSGMLDVYSDLTQQAAVFGNHFELLEMCELVEFRSSVTDEDVQLKIKEFGGKFDISSNCKKEDVVRAAKTSVALDRLIEKHNLGSMAYYYEGSSGNEYENIVTSVIAGNTLLTGRGIPIAGEGEVKNVQAMKIMDIFNAGGSFAEFYLADFKDDVIYLGHDGPAHIDISEGDVGLVPLPVYHGKPGKGLSIQMTVKHGPVTILSVVQHGDGKLMLLIAEGESVPGPILNIGNTNSRYHFSIGAKRFMNQWAKNGPAHHCAIGIGHLSGKIEKLASLLGIEMKQIC